MPGYLIARINVTNHDLYRRYTDATPALIAKFGGRFIVRGGEVTTLEGEKENSRVVVIEFPSLEKVREFFASPEYQAAKRLREGAAEGQFIAVAGVEL